MPSQLIMLALTWPYAFAAAAPKVQLCDAISVPVEVRNISGEPILRDKMQPSVRRRYRARGRSGHAACALTLLARRIGPRTAGRNGGDVAVEEQVQE